MGDILYATILWYQPTAGAAWKYDTQKYPRYEDYYQHAIQDYNFAAAVTQAPIFAQAEIGFMPNAIGAVMYHWDTAQQWHVDQTTGPRSYTGQGFVQAQGEMTLPGTPPAPPTSRRRSGWLVPVLILAGATLVAVKVFTPGLPFWGRRVRGNAAATGAVSRASADAIFDEELHQFVGAFPHTADVGFGIRAEHPTPPEQRTKRDLAWWDPDRRMVFLVEDALKRSTCTVRGLIRHELGHAADSSPYGTESELRADRLAEQATGEALRYTADGVQNACVGVPKRPAWLPA